MASLRAKAENAVTTHLSDSGVTVPIYKGFAGTDKEVPCVVVVVRRAEEEPYQSGNYRVLVDIHIKGDPDASVFDPLAEAVRGYLWNDGLAASLQASETDFRVFGASAPHVMEWTEDGDIWVETQTVELYCAVALTTA